MAVNNHTPFSTSDILPDVEIKTWRSPSYDADTLKRLPDIIVIQYGRFVPAKGEMRVGHIYVSEEWFENDFSREKCIQFLVNDLNYWSSNPQHDMTKRIFLILLNKEPEEANGAR